MNSLTLHTTRESYIAANATSATCAIGGMLKRAECAQVALAGGSTPAEILPVLFSAPLDWERVVLTVSDERTVPREHPLSNLGQVERLAAGTAAARARIVPLAELDRQAAGALALLWAGVGEDGHTLSWFPGPDLDACYDSGEAVLSVRPDPLPAAAPVPRLTLSLSAARGAHTILIAARGEAKRAIIENPGDLPVARLLALPQTVVHWAP